MSLFQTNRRIHQDNLPTARCHANQRQLELEDWCRIVADAESEGSPSISGTDSKEEGSDGVSGTDEARDKEYWPPQFILWFEEIKDEIDEAVELDDRGRNAKFMGELPQSTDSW